MARAGSTTDEVVLRPGAADDTAAPDARAADAGDAHRRASPPDRASAPLPLLDPAQSDALTARWTEVQARFVDDPQAAVRDADALVAELTAALAASFAAHREGLEASWRTGSEPGTEQLRQALQSYRSFFARLLHT